MPALAQLEEIIVTARKTAETIQTTPVAVTALNEAMLARAQVTELVDLQRTAPNLSVMSGGTGSSALIYVAIRGNAQVSPSGGTDPAVATYVDGVYLARPTGGNVDMFDVSNAEVLRGPQGTLFGRNTTGGALNIHTNDPVPGDFEGYVKGEIGNYNHKKVEAVVNVPLMGDELAARIAARYNDRDGFGDYRGYTDPAGFVSNGLDHDAGDVEENTYARAKIKWTPDDRNFIATLGFDYSKFEDSGQRTKVVGLNPAAAGGIVGLIFNSVGFSPDTFLAQLKEGDSYWNMGNSTVNPYPADPRLSDSGSTNESKGVNLNLEFDLGDYTTFKSITAYREATSSGAVDLDGTPVHLLAFYSIWDQDQFSQEFQLSGSVNDDLDWITGLYYFTEDSSDFSVNRFGGGDLALALERAGLAPPNVPLAAIGAHLSTNDAEHESTSYGGYAQANYSFTDKLRGTVGFRYTYDKRVTTIFSEDMEFGQGFPVECLMGSQYVTATGCIGKEQNARFEYPAWVVSMDYQARENLFLYAKTSGASMAGGWNFRAPDNESFGPEQVTDIEVGFKSDLFDRTLRINGAFFYMKATDQQRLVNVARGTTPVQFIRNAGKSEATGAELELSWLPWEGMLINSSLAWLDMEYEKYESTELVTSGPNMGQLVTVDRSGENAPHAPELTLSIGATQTLQTALGEVNLHVDYYWVDETWFQDNTVNPFEGPAVQAIQREEQRHNSVPSYGLVNAQASLLTNDGQWEFTLWGKNLGDKEYFTSVANFWNAFGTSSLFYGDPRTFGASVQYNW